MNRDKLIRELEKWAVKRKKKGWDDNLLREAVAQICELNRQLELLRGKETEK